MTARLPWERPCIQAWRWVSLASSVAGVGLLLAYQWTGHRWASGTASACFLLSAVSYWVYSERVRTA